MARGGCRRVVVVAGLVGWVVVLALGSTLSGRQMAVVVPLVLLAGVAVVAPFVGWSAGLPDDHRSASLWALAGGGALTVLVLVAAWVSRRWVSSESAPIPPLPSPSVDAVLRPTTISDT